MPAAQQTVERYTRRNAHELMQRLQADVVTLRKAHPELSVVLLADGAPELWSLFRQYLNKRTLGTPPSVSPTAIVMGVDPQTTVWLLGAGSKRSEGAASVRDVAVALDEPGEFRRCTWRKGTKTDLSARFAARRVIPAYEEANLPADQREELAAGRTTSRRRFPSA